MEALQTVFEYIREILNMIKGFLEEILPKKDEEAGE